MNPMKLQKNSTELYDRHPPTLVKMNTVPELTIMDDVQKEKMYAHFQKDESSSPFRFVADFLDIYSFGGLQEKVLMGLGIVIALGSGVIVPLFMYYWGKQTDHIIQHYQNLADTMDDALQYYMAIVGLALGSFLINALTFSLWKALSERIAYKFRVKYVQAFIGRSMGWLQQQNLYEVSSKFRSNCLTIQKATGDKVALFYYLIGVVMSGAISAVCVRWTFALYLVALVPIGALALGYFIYVLIMRKNDTKEFFEEAESQAVEATALIKTVKMLRCEKAQEVTYNHRLEEYLKRIGKYPLKMGISTALFYFIQYFIFGVGFLFGIQCVRGTSACPVSVTGSLYSIGDMHIVFFQTYVCSYYFLQLASNYDSIKGAIVSSKEAFRFIREAQQQETNHSTEKALSDSVKDIQFRNVEFAYPSKPDRMILRRLNLKLLKNKFNAVVGATGSGKSTIAQLLLKFYTQYKGEIRVGGTNITQLDAEWLRERIGYVGQEPTLFSGTLRENVTVGKADATDEEVWHVLEQVNMRDFATKQPEGLNYDVGLGGQRLSGGQKQRVAIARALIKKPSLLILDEATSALDRKSEKLIQNTFESLFTKNMDMTVLCIAHRVRTIVKADRIFYIESGAVKEQGTFRELNYFKDIEVAADEEMTHEEFLDEMRPWKHLSEREAEKEQQAQPFQDNIYSKLLEHTQHKGQYAIALLLSFLSGLSHPAAIYLLANVYSQEIEMITFSTITGWCSNALSPPGCMEQLDGYHNTAVKYLGGLIGFSLLAFLPYFAQNYLMTKIEDEITHSLRKRVFGKLMLMPVRWHERPENEGGQVGASSSVDVKNASTLVSTYIPTLVTNFTTVVSGIVVCIAYFWQVGLLSLVSIPLIAVGGYISMLFISGYEDEEAHRYQRSDKLAIELMINIKAVLSLNFQRRMLEKYVSWLENDPLASLKRGAKIGFFFGLSLFIILLAIGSALYADNYIIMNLSLQTALNIVIAITVPMWCGWVAGNNFYFIAKAGAGKQSARRIFQLLQEPTEAQEQQKWSGRGVVATPSQTRGRIQFKNVSFRYNTQSPYALRNVSLVIEGGQKAAFVGESGCGKSTLMLLLQRFYPFEGQITLDGISILDYDLATYRGYFAVLNQEPSLFTATVRQNVTLGTEASEKEVSDACRTALAYDMSSAWKGRFSIQESIQEFLNRDAGIKGSKLSGGEKQRVACARAVLKKPQVFLMDEGTSALDRDTEHRVQNNIDQSLKGITLVSIAHRIQTIEDSDIIFLFEGGKVAESGRYSEMMERKTYFYNFVQGEKYKTINQIAELILRRLVAKLLGISFKRPQGGPPA